MESEPGAEPGVEPGPGVNLRQGNSDSSRLDYIIMRTQIWPSAEPLFAYDFICTDVDDGPSAEIRAAAKAERKRQAQERARRAAAEGAILMNCLPMVSEYLKEAGMGPLPAAEVEEAARGLPAGENGSGVVVEGGDQDGAAAGDKDDDGDDFVYDVYVPVEEGGEGGEASADGVPVLEVRECDVSSHLLLATLTMFLILSWNQSLFTD